MKMKVSDDTATVEAVRKGLKETGGYCPCRIEKAPATKCPCEEFRTQTQVGETCHCCLYIKTEM